MFKAALVAAGIALSNARTLVIPASLPGLKAGEASAPLQLRDVTSCTTADDLAKNFVASTNVTSPAVGDYVGLTYDYDLSVEVTGGSVTYDCTINSFLPYSFTDDLCTDQANGGDPCPLAVGHHTDVGGILVSSGVSKLKCTITWTTTDSTQILCATAAWTVAA